LGKGELDGGQLMGDGKWEIKIKKDEMDSLASQVKS